MAAENGELPSHADQHKIQPGQVAPNAELHNERAGDTGRPYSIFKPWEKKAIVFTASLSAVFSPMSTTIYLPALNQLAADLHVSDSEINLTVTTFMIVQGLAPSFIAGFSDRAGRRPAFIACYIIYIAANFGLAFQRSYAALMVLRCLQSAGSSGTVALAQGVIADVVTSAERGQYIAYTSVASIVGPIAGPILGGILAQYGGWEWIFYFLIIASGALLIPVILFFPETCRKVVGDGSVPPPLASVSLTSIIKNRHRRAAGVEVSEAERQYVADNYKVTIPNPLSTLMVVFDKENAIILFCSGLVVSCLYAVNVGIPSQFGKIYGFDEIKIGLVFIPFGAGSILSAFTTGKLVDASWRRHAKIAGLPVVKNRAQDLLGFPVERARLVVAMPLLYVACAGLITYGWVLDFQTNLAGPLVVLFFTGCGVMPGFQVTQILMLDLNPGNPAASTAANNLFRCLLGAGTSAVIVPMFNKMTVGWTYTFLALVWVVFSPSLWVLSTYGPRWRRAKRDKALGKQAELALHEASGHGDDERSQTEDENEKSPKV